MHTGIIRVRAISWPIIGAIFCATLCGAAIRVRQAHSASVIAQDGIVYVTMARSMEHDWRACIREDPQFGYPLLIKWTHALVGPHLANNDLMRWQRSAQYVSILGGTICIPAVYWLGRRLLSRRAGLLAAWSWAFLPDAVRFSADALSDMPCLALMLWGAAAAMIGLQAHSIAPFLWAGILSGAAYALRAEGGEVAFVTTILILISCRGGFGWRLNAIAATIAGFAVFGGSYIWLEGGSILSEKPFLHVQFLPGLYRELLATWIGQPATAFPILADLDTRPLFVQIKDILHVSWTVIVWQTLRSLYQLALQVGNSMNGVWMVLGLAYFFLPGRKKLRPGWRRIPLTLAGVHTVALLLLYVKGGYLTRRHVMLLDIWLMIVAAGTLVWFTQQVSKHAQRAVVPVSQWKVFLAQRSGSAIALAIILCTLPWLLRDIGDGRWHVHDAARWIQQQYPGRSNLRIVTQHSWVPFYAGQSSWRFLWPDIKTCRHLPDAELLILDRSTGPPPSSMSIPKTADRLEFAEAAKFVDSDGRRSIALYRVKRIVATSKSSPIR